MIVLDGTVVNVALPSIQSDLAFSQSDLAWVVNAYMIAFGGLLLLAGRLGDLIGSKRVFVAGVIVFTGASLLCGLAWNRELLVAARFVQGTGGAMASSVILAMIVTMFQKPTERAKAMGVFSFTAAAGGSIGLLIGGALTQALNWHWIFLINVPIGTGAAILAVRLLEAHAWDRVARGSRRARRSARDRVADDRRFHRGRDSGERRGVGAYAGVRRGRGVALRRVHRPPSDGGEAVASPSSVPLA